MDIVREKASGIQRSNGLLVVLIHIDSFDTYYLVP